MGKLLQLILKIKKKKKLAEDKETKLVRTENFNSYKIRFKL